MLYIVTFTINISPMLAYIPYMDPMGMAIGQMIERFHHPLTCAACVPFWPTSLRLSLTQIDRGGFPGGIPQI